MIELAQSENKVISAKMFIGSKINLNSKILGKVY